MDAHSYAVPSIRVHFGPRERVRLVDFYCSLILDPLIPRLHLWNLTPNFITVARATLIVVILPLIASGEYVAACIVFLISSLGDHFDGVLARFQDAVLTKKDGQPWWWVKGSSEFGKFLDPACDKLVNQLTIFSLIEYFSDLGGFVVATILSGEILLFILAAFKYANSKRWVWKDKEVETGSNRWGRGKTAAHIIVVSFMLAAMPFSRSYAIEIGQILLACTLPLSLGSILGHLNQIRNAKPRFDIVS